MSKQNLAPEQEQIVEEWLTSEKPMLIEASAGSGKTRILTESVRRIIERNAKVRSKILCLTFSRKAAEEMQERLADVRKINERAFINTTHSFALEIIKSRRHELGMDAMPTILDKESDRKEILKEVFLSNPLLLRYYENLPENLTHGDLSKYQSILLSKCLRFISKKKQKLVWSTKLSNSVDSDWTPYRISLYEDYNTLLRNQNLIDYDDIILLAWKILSERPAVAKLYRRIYRYVLIDEAQDLNFAQYEFIKALCGKSIKSVMMVGDSKQAIYGYAGANSRFMTKEFVTDFSLSPNQIKKIEYNYRSSERIIDLANEVIGMPPTNIDNYYKGIIEFASFENEDLESDWIINKLHDLIGMYGNEYDGELTLSKIGILGRNRFVFNNLISKLEKDKLFANNFFLKRGAEILDPQSTTMKIFDLGTRIICNERAYLYQNQLFDVLDIRDKSGFLISSQDFKGLKIILEKNQLDFIPETLYLTILECWEDIQVNINRFPEVLKKIANSVSNIEETSEKNLALNDIEEWDSAWSKYVRSVSANAKSISDFRRFIAMGITKNQSQKGLTLGTIHTVKGLEFYVVFLIGVGEGTFPDYRALRKNNIEEERNNAYVAITRAKRELYITYPMNKKVPWGNVKQGKSQFFGGKEFKSY